MIWIAAALGSPEDPENPEELGADEQADDRHERIHVHRPALYKRLHDLVLEPLPDDDERDPHDRGGREAHRNGGQPDDDRAERRADERLPDHAWDDYSADQPDPQGQDQVHGEDDDGPQRADPARHRVDQREQREGEERPMARSRMTLRTLDARYSASAVATMMSTIRSTPLE